MAVALVVLAAAAPAFAQKSIEEKLPPKPERYITDLAGVLPPDRAEALNRKLEQFERDNYLVVSRLFDARIDGFGYIELTRRRG